MAQIPVLIIIDKTIVEHYVARENTHIIGDYCIDTSNVNLMFDDKKLQFSTKYDQLKLNDSIIGPAGMWTLSNKSNVIKRALYLKGGTFYAKCNENCIVLGVNKENFTIIK